MIGGSRLPDQMVYYLEPVIELDNEVDSTLAIEMETKERHSGAVNSHCIRVHGIYSTFHQTAII
jgi:hypothetical protein